MESNRETSAIEPKCADCTHGILTHNAIGGACTKCDCGHFRAGSRCLRPAPACRCGHPYTAHDSRYVCTQCDNCAGYEPAAAAEHRCLRPACGRKLTSARSIAAGYGPKCAAKIRKAAREHALDGLNDRQRDKALEIVADGGVIPSAHKGVFLVPSGDGERAYRCTPDHCSRPWGVRRASATVKPCAHVGAVRLLALTSRKSLAKAV